MTRSGSELIRDVSRQDRGTVTITLARGFTVVARPVADRKKNRDLSLIQLLADSEGRIWTKNPAFTSPRELETDVRDALDGADELGALTDSPSLAVASLGERIQEYLETGGMD